MIRRGVIRGATQTDALFRSSWPLRFPGGAHTPQPFHDKEAAIAR